MSTKTIAALAGVVAALGLGFYLGLSRATEAPLPPLAATPDHVQAIARLRGENLRLKADVARINAANTALQPPAAPLAAPPRTAAAAPQELPAPLPALVAINQQRAMMNNLRQVAAAVNQFHLEKNRAPAALGEILGPTKYIRALNPVAGESYAGVSLALKSPITVVTPGGLAVTYDPTGSLTTDLAAASQQANETARRVLVERFGVEFVDRLTPSIQKAIEGYRAVHGRPPSAPSDALPDFETPQAGADFLEFSEVARALGMKM